MTDERYQPGEKMVRGTLMGAVVDMAREAEVFCLVRPADCFGGLDTAKARAKDIAAMFNGAGQPIPMLLFCPNCGLQHVDTPDEAKGWTNPPHRSHLCHGCDCIWRPADVATTGVDRIGTRGAADNWFPHGRVEAVGWQPIDTVTMHELVVVTDGENYALSALEPTDWGGTYWALDGDGQLDWMPTRWVFPPRDEPPLLLTERVPA